MSSPEPSPDPGSGSAFHSPTLCDSKILQDLLQSFADGFLPTLLALHHLLRELDTGPKESLSAPESKNMK